MAESGGEASLFTAWRALVARDLVLAMRRRADVLTTLFFFLIVVSLFPLGVSPELETLRGIAPGVIWVAALLASMLSLGRLFSGDYQDGTLEQILLLPQPLSVLVLAFLVAFAVYSSRNVYLDVAIAYAFIAFLGAIALARFLMRAYKRQRCENREEKLDE